MFSEEDVRRAVQVKPLDSECDPDMTMVNWPLRGDEYPEPRLPLFATAVVIFSSILLTAPKGAVLNAIKRLWHQQENASVSNVMGSSGLNINANNSNVQNLQIINNGGQVNVSGLKK